MKPFRRIQTTDRDLNLLQDHIKDVFDSIAAGALVDARFLSGVALSSGTNLVGHGLGKRYSSWGWMRPSAAVTLYETASPDATRLIALVASTACVVDLFVL